MFPDQIYLATHLSFNCSKAHVHLYKYITIKQIHAKKNRAHQKNGTKRNEMHATAAAAHSLQHRGHYSPFFTLYIHKSVELLVIMCAARKHTHTHVKYKEFQISVLCDPSTRSRCNATGRRRLRFCQSSSARDLIQYMFVCT